VSATESQAPEDPTVAHRPEERMTRPERPAGSPSRAPGGFQGARIEIPAIKVSATVLRGTTLAALAKGPGWYEESALPGEGNTAIAGHRTMYGAWFRNTDKLRAGDVINIIYEGQVYEYSVEKVFPISNNDWSVIEPCGYPALTLTTCHPPGSAVQRLVVRARLVERR
jgi:sortase A